ncbi:MAG: PfkB family carbohydrate kinase [Terriglobia bacterium]
MKIISIGEVLWDVVGAEEHLGGAPFNFAAHAKRLGHTVHFVSAVGTDPRGHRVLERMAEMGLSTRYVRRISGQPTGIVSVRLDSARQPTFTIHHPAAYDFTELSDAQAAELLSERPDWIYFGTLFQMSAQGRAVVKKLIEPGSGARVFYDVNLRAGCFEARLVEDLMSVAGVVKLNDLEAARMDEMFGRPHGGLEDFCRYYTGRFGGEGVCITRGAGGCVALLEGKFLEAPGYHVEVVDAIGAGDAFAAAFIHGMNEGWPAVEIADFANRVGALVASRPGAIPRWTLEEVKSLHRA